MLLKILYWLPRILAILAIMFMLMFGFDSFSGDQPFGKELIGFLMSSIPGILLIVVLVVAWKQEIIGGTIFIVISVVLGIYFKSFTTNPASLIILAPFFLVGILFILHHILRPK